MNARIILVWLALTCPTQAETLRTGGVGAATNLLPALQKAWNNDQVAFEVIPSLGSNGGLKALSEGALQFAVSGRPLNDAEVKKGLRVLATFRSPFVLASSYTKPIEVNAKDVASLYASAKSTWPDGTFIRVILRPKSDSDTPILTAMFPGMSEALGVVRTRPDVLIAPTDQDNADAAERIPGSLTAIMLTQVITESRRLNLLTIDGVHPTLDALEDGAYPYSKNLYLVAPANRAAAIDTFLAYLRTPAGVDALRKLGVSPAIASAE